MNILLVLLAALHQNTVRNGPSCPYQPVFNSVNVPPIFFRNHYSFNATGNGQALGQVGAYSPWNSRVWFSLVGTNDVTVDRNSGSLRVITTLRQDHPKYQRFYAVATDSHYKSATVLVTVNLTRSDEGRPSALRFDLPWYNATVRPDHPLDRSAFSVHASGPMNDTLEYSILNTFSFRVDRLTGAVYPTQTLTSNTRHYFFIQATYQSYPNIRAVVNVTVIVSTNTTSRALSLQSVTAQVYSDVTRSAYVTTIRAVAADPARQGQIRYSITGTSSLRIDPYTGVVYVNWLPLYHTTTATVRAALGGLTAQTSLVVTKTCRPGVPVTQCFADPCSVVIREQRSPCPQAMCLANYCGGCHAEFYHHGDRVNCSSPTRPARRLTNPTRQYQAEVTENTPAGTRVVDLYELEGTSLPPPNLNLTFAVVSGGNGMFAVSERGVVTILQFLDHDKTQRYNLLVRAIQTGPGGPSTADIQLIVRVLNVNDNSPQFEGLTSPFIVPSGLNFGDIVFRFMATDFDPMDTVYYQLIGGNSTIFQVGADSGVASVRTTLPEGVYNLQVQASDSGIPSRSSVASLELRSVSRTSGYPIFHVSFVEVSLSEASPGNTFVTSVPVSVGERISYRKVPNTDPLGIFRVDSTGNVYTNVLLDREGLDKASCVVEAQNLDTELKSYIQVFMDVENVNDNSPVFPYSVYYAAVPRNAPQGTHVFTAEASDLDLQSQLTYSIVSGDINSVFDIVDDNEIVLARSIEGEAFTYYELGITASDGLHTGSATLMVNVTGMWAN